MLTKFNLTATVNGGTTFFVRFVNCRVINDRFAGKHNFLTTGNGRRIHFPIRITFITVFNFIGLKGNMIAVNTSASQVIKVSGFNHGFTVVFIRKRID